MERGEGVVGDLGARVADGGDEGGLARVGHAQQAHVGQHLQFQLEAAALARPAGGFLARRTVDGALEAQVAKAAVAALGDHDLLARRQQLEQHVARLGVADDGAHRHLQRDVVAGCAEHVRAHAVLAAPGLVPARVAKVDQRVQVGVGHREHVAAAPTVAAVGSAEFLEFLVAEGHAAIATIAGGNVDERFVNEFHDFKCRACSARRPETPKPRAAGLWPGPGFDEPQAVGVTLTRWRFRAPLTAKDTWPSTSANRVWSLPTPTLVPG